MEVCTDIVTPKNGMIYGPFVPLSNEEIATSEVQEFHGTLGEHDRMVLQGMHQYAKRGQAYIEAGELEAAEPFQYHAQRIHQNVFNAVRDRSKLSA